MTAKIGVTQGIGVVVASMIGSGIFVSTGFMLQQELTPSEIMMEWIIGGLWAFCGAILYVHIAQKTPINGGEPLYIRKYISEDLGYIITFLTILVGFVCPIVFDSFVAASYIDSMILLGNPQLIASIIILFFVFINLNPSLIRVSDIVQQTLVYIKILIVLSIIGIGFWWLFETSSHTPYEPISYDTRVNTLMGQQYWVVYAFSGFNAAIYIVERFKAPERQIKISIFGGLSFVLCCYLLLNHIFVQALIKADIPQAALNDNFTQITMCHILLQKMLGPSYGNLMSILMVFIFLSSISVMLQLVIPVCFSLRKESGDQKADDRFTMWSVIGLGLVSLLLIWVSEIAKILASISFMIYLVSSLTISTILFNRLPGYSSIPIRILSFIYICISQTLLTYGIMNSDMVYESIFLIIFLPAWLCFRKFKGSAAIKIVNNSNI